MEIVIIIESWTWYWYRVHCCTLYPWYPWYPWHSFYDDDGVVVRPSCVGVAKVVSILCNSTHIGPLWSPYQPLSVLCIMGNLERRAWVVCKTIWGKKGFQVTLQNHSHAAKRHSSGWKTSTCCQIQIDTLYVPHVYHVDVFCWILLFPMYICTYAWPFACTAACVRSLRLSRHACPLIRPDRCYYIEMRVVMYASVMWSCPLLLDGTWRFSLSWRVRGKNKVATLSLKCGRARGNPVLSRHGTLSWRRPHKVSRHIFFFFWKRC